MEGDKTMTRYKKEIKRHGFKLESDLPMIPYDCGNQNILGIYVNLISEGIQILTEYNSLVSEAVIDRAGKIEYYTL